VATDDLVALHQRASTDHLDRQHLKARQHVDKYADGGESYDQSGRARRQPDREGSGRGYR